MPKPVKQTPTGRKPKRGSAVSRIKDMSFSDDDPIKILLYGRSAAGKTTTWGTFPGKILCLVCSRGNETGELRSLDTPSNRGRIAAVPVEKTEDFDELIPHLQESDEYGTVVLDHISGLYDLALKETLGLDELPIQKSWGMATRQQYGTAGAKTKELARRLLSLPVNIVIVAQERSFGDDEDENSSELCSPTVGPGVAPSVLNWLTSAVDYTAQCFIRPKMRRIEKKAAGKTKVREVRGVGVEYCLRCEPHDIYYTKFRVSGGIPEGQGILVDPTYEKIIDLIRGRG